MPTEARRRQQDPLAFVADRDLSGDLVDDERSPLYRATPNVLRTRRVRATIDELLRDRQDLAGRAR